LIINSVDANELFNTDYLCTTSGNTVTCPKVRGFDATRPFTLTIVGTTTECGTFTNTDSSSEDSGSVTYTVNCLPTTKVQCKNGGWTEFGYPDEGTCQSDVNRRSR
jgi:hypothetical protein